MNIGTEYLRRCAGQSDIVDHLPRLYDEVCRYPGASVIELGVRSGNSTAAFLAAAEQIDGHVWSVDIAWPRRIPNWWGDSGRWTLLLGDDLAGDILDALPETADVVFIDTSHTYEQTCAELATYSRRVNPGGVILCHDTELMMPEGTTAPPFPVRKAIDEFVAETPGYSVEFVSGCFGLGVIRKEG